MWQITWALSLLPDWFWTALLITGIFAVVASVILGVVPFIKQYKMPIQVSGIISIIVSVWFLGAASNEEKWQVKIRELEDKVKLAEEKSKETNTEIQEKVVKQKEYIKGKTEYITKYIDKLETKEVIKEVQGPERVRVEEVIKYIENCPVPKELINIHDAAATLNKAAGDSKK
jgi:hypothetical protein